MAKEIIYKMNDMPKPFGKWAVLGFQHVFALFGATTLVPLIFGPAIGMDKLQIGVFISSVYLAMGIATLLQVFWIGSGLPIVQGSSFSFIPPVLVIIETMRAGGAGADSIMAAIAAAIIAGGVLEAIIGYSKLVGMLKKVLTPVVIGPVIMMIGFCLAPVAFQNASGNWWISLLVVALIFVFSLVARKPGVRIVAVLLAVVIGYLAALSGSAAGVFGPGDPAHVDFSKMAEARWFLMPVPLRYGFHFEWGFFFAILAAYLASMIESVGDYYSVSLAAGEPEPSRKKISRGIGCEGVGCVISGILGGVGTTSYTENIGLINITGVASRYVVGMGAVILIIMGLFGKLGVLIATVPTPVIGGAYIALFGVIGALGIQVLMRADMRSQRNVMIVGFAVLSGLGVPQVVEQMAKANPAFSSLDTGMALRILYSIGRCGMAVSAIIGIVLDQLMPGTPRERGINK